MIIYKNANTFAAGRITFRLTSSSMLVFYYPQAFGVSA